MRKLETLFKEFINAPIQIYSGATFKKGLYDLTQVYENTVSGDLVIVKGNHDIGDNSIQLKDGVNWEFIGKPIITSDSVNGTFKDGGVVISTNFTGDLTILNTSGFSKRIQLTFGSKIDGFYFVLRYKVIASDNVTVYENSLLDPNDLVNGAIPFQKLDPSSDEWYFMGSKDFVQSWNNAIVQIEQDITKTVNGDIVRVSALFATNKIFGYGFSDPNTLAVTNYDFESQYAIIFCIKISPSSL